MFFKKTEESDAEETNVSEMPAETANVDEETREKIIAEYLATVNESRPKAVIVEGGGIPVVPVKRPRTLREAAAYAREIIEKQKGE